MTRQFHNFTDDDVPEPRVHANRYRAFSRNASGRACVCQDREAWIASDTTVAVRP